MQISGADRKMRVVTIKLGYVSLYRLSVFVAFIGRFVAHWNFGIFSANLTYYTLLYVFFFCDRCKSLLANKLYTIAKWASA